MTWQRQQLTRIAPAALLALAGLWLVVQQVVLAAGGGGAAAVVGVVRGDLWAKRTQVMIASGQADDAVVAAAGRWAVFSPLSGEAWLAMAERLPAGEEPRKRDVIAMAFAAGPGEVEQMPRRLVAAAGSTAITDAMIEQYVRRDISYLLNRGSRGEQILRDVDRRASPLGRYRLRAMFVDISPAFAASLPSY